MFDYEFDVCLLETRHFVYTIVCSWGQGTGNKGRVMT